MSRATAVFSTDEYRVLTSVLDAIIPPSADGRLPGAGAIGLASAIAGTLQHTPDLPPVFSAGLAAIEARARAQAGSGFAALTADAQAEVLQAIAAEEQGFFALLLFHTYAAYYQDVRVQQALGLEPRPPHPQGYDMRPPDLTLLDPVRQRGRRYRRC